MRLTAANAARVKSCCTEGCPPRNPGARSRCARNPLRARLHLCEAATPEPITQKPAWKGGFAYRPRPGNFDLAIESFPHLADFRKPRFLPRAKCAQRKALPSGLRCNPG